MTGDQITHAVITMCLHLRIPAYDDEVHDWPRRKQAREAGAWGQAEWARGMLIHF